MGFSQDHDMNIYFTTREDATNFYEMFRKTASHSDRIVWDNFDDYDMEGIMNSFGFDYDWNEFRDTFFLTLSSNKVSFNSGGYGQIDDRVWCIANRNFNAIGYTNIIESCQCETSENVCYVFDGKDHNTIEYDDFEMDEDDYENTEYTKAVETAISKVHNKLFIA